MNGFLEMLAAHAAEPVAKVDPEAAMMRLSEASPRFTRANPFKEGDWVTPIKDSPVLGHGDPHLVVETCTVDAAQLPDRCEFVRRDLRVVFLCTEPRCQSIHAGWFANAEFEVYRVKVS